MRLRCARGIAAIVLAAVAAGCGKSAGQSESGSGALTLSALRLAGDPPARSLVTVAENGAVGRALQLNLPTSRRLVAFARSSDGTRIFLTASSDEGATDVFSVKPDGSRLHQLTSDGASGTPVPSPDGRQVAFAKAHGGRANRSELWLMDADGSHQHRLVAAADANLQVAGAWSPDGLQLAFTRCHLPAYGDPAYEDHCAIYLVNTDGSHLRRIAHAGLLPDWSPDGKQIVFMSTRDHTRTISQDSDTGRYAAELYLMDANGNHQRRLTTTPRLEESNPRWSPGGKRIAYQRRGDAFRTRLFQINADGTCPTPITPAHGSAWFSLPEWNAPIGPSEPRLQCP